MVKGLLWLVAAARLWTQVAAHGYLSVPASRTVLHKGGAKGPGDLASFSGGGPAQEKVNGHGLCGGVIGDPSQGFMDTGPYGRVAPDAARTFTQGQTIDISVVITAHHYGWFEFRLCDSADKLTQEAGQSCLNQHVLEFDEEFTKGQFNGQMQDGVSSPADYVGNPSVYSVEHVKCQYLPNNGPGGSCCRGGGVCSSPANNKNRWMLPKPVGAYGTSLTYTTKYKLPAGVVCDNCVLQWYWQTGNSPDSYPEAFWGCSDIKIAANGAPTSPPVPLATQTPAPSVINAPVPSSAPIATPTVKPASSTQCFATNELTTDAFCASVKGCDAGSLYGDLCSLKPASSGGSSSAGLIAGIVCTLFAVGAIVAFGVRRLKKTRLNNAKYDERNQIKAF